MEHCIAWVNVKYELNIVNVLFLQWWTLNGESRSAIRQRAGDRKRVECADLMDPDRHGNQSKLIHGKNKRPNIEAEIEEICMPAGVN